MKFRQLEALRAVLMYGNISRAAEALNISQPAVSRLISDLEYSVGFALFERRQGRLFPTPEARSFSEELDRSFIGLDRLRQAAEEIRDLRRGEVHISAMPSVSLEIIPEIIREFCSHHTEVKVTFDLHTSARIVELVAAGQFHLGFSQMAIPTPGVDILHSFRTRCVCVMKADHPLASKKVVRPEHLRDQNLVAFAYHTMASASIMQMLVETDTTVRTRIECQPSHVVCSLALQGVGIALVDPMTARFFAPMNLVARPFKPEIPFDFRLLKPKDVALSNVARTFEEITLENLKKDKLIEMI